MIRSSTNNPSPSDQAPLLEESSLVTYLARRSNRWFPLLNKPEIILIKLPKV